MCRCTCTRGAEASRSWSARRWSARPRYALKPCDKPYRTPDLWGSAILVVSILGILCPESVPNARDVWATNGRGACAWQHVRHSMLSSQAQTLRETALAIRATAFVMPSSVTLFVSLPHLGFQALRETALEGPSDQSLAAALGLPPSVEGSPPPVNGSAQLNSVESSEVVDRCPMSPRDLRYFSIGASSMPRPYQSSQPGITFSSIGPLTPLTPTSVTLCCCQEAHRTS